MIHGEDGAVAWLGESARVGKRYRGRKILSRIGEGKLYWERGRWQQRGSLLRPWSSCRGWCPDCPRRGKWTEVENRRAARIPRIPSSAHSERPRQFPFHTFVISKIHKIYKKNYAVGTARRRFWRGSEGQRPDIRGENGAEPQMVDASDSPLPLHSHPDDAQRLLVVFVCGCVLLPGFSS